MIDLDGIDNLARYAIGELSDSYQMCNFHAAANPATILALTAEVRRLRADAKLWRTEMSLRNDPTVAIMFAGVDNRCVIYRGGIAISAAGTYAEAIAAAHPKEGV